jgi:hypothetical protein
VPNVHAIFWGRSWNEEKPSKLREQLMKLYNGLSGSAWQGILTQYFDQNGYVSSTVRASKFTDERALAPENVSRATLETEIEEAIPLQNEAAKSKGETPWDRNEPDAQFVVFLPPATTYTPFTGACAYHTGGGHVPYFSWSFIPDMEEKEFNGCVGEGETSAAASHEYAETATDPHLTSWRTTKETGSAEIADYCPGYIVPFGTTGSFVQPIGDEHLELTCELSDPAPPHVLAITEPATNIVVPEATLNGSAYAENLETSYRFDYGTTTKYGKSISAGTSSAGSGFTLQEVHRVTHGLHEKTIYHYQLVATNASGETKGADQTFTEP